MLVGCFCVQEVRFESVLVDAIYPFFVKADLVSHGETLRRQAFAGLSLQAQRQEGLCRQTSAGTPLHVGLCRQASGGKFLRANLCRQAAAGKPPQADL